MAYDLMKHTKVKAVFKDSYDNEIDVKKLSIDQKPVYYGSMIMAMEWLIDIETVTGEKFAIVGNEFHEIGEHLSAIYSLSSWEVDNNKLDGAFTYTGTLRNGGIIKLEMTRKGEDQCEKHQRKRSRGLLKTIFKMLKTSSSFRK